MSHRSTLVLVTVLAALLSPSVSADIKPKPLASGGPGITPKDPSEGTVPVEMAWEVVDIHPGLGHVKVEARFGLVNRSSEAVSFEVGFPSYFEKTLQDFTASIDGKAVRFELKKTEQTNRRSRRTYFVYWLCWNMSFEGNQEREVKVTYGVDTHHNTLLGYNQFLPRDDRKRLFWHESGYVLRTGADWKGPIGRAEINVHYTSEVPKGALTFAGMRQPWEYDEKANAERLVLKDLEPKPSHDVRFRYRSMPAKEEVAYLEKLITSTNVKPAVWSGFVQLLEAEGNPLGLTAEQRDDKAVAVLGKALPPNGPTPRWSRLFSSHRRHYRTAVTRLLGALERRQDDAALRAALGSWVEGLEAFLAKDARYKGMGGRRGQQYAALEKECADAKARLAALK